MTERIVVVGGGFAGFWAAIASKRVAGDRADVTLISQEPVLQIRPRLYEANPEHFGVALRPILDSVGVRFVHDQAIGIDLEGRAVLLTRDRVSYARLVVATGSRASKPPIPGATDAYSIDTQRDAIAFDARLAQIAETIKRPTVVVVGAGFTGIELTLELRDRLAAHGDEALAQRARIVLIGRAQEVGHDLGPGPRPLIESALSDAHVECHLGAAVCAIGNGSLTLGDGRMIRADAVVLTTGLVAAPFVRQVPGERDALGRLFVDGSLRAPDAPEVFVAGDAAAADTGDGHLALQSCQHALQLGRFAGENAARDLLGLPTLRYSQLEYDTCLDLGRSGAVFTDGWEREIVESGALAKARKQRINRTVIYPPATVPADILLGLSSTDQRDQKIPAPT